MKMSTGIGIIFTNNTTMKNKLLTPSSDENVNGNWNNFLQTIKNKFLTPSLDENVNSNVNVQSRITLAKPGAPKLGKMSQFVGNLGTFCYKQYKVTAPP